MAVTIKTQREIDLMRESCRLLAKVHEELAQAIEPGISTLYIDQLGEKIIRGYGCIPNFLQYNGYPASICVSVMTKWCMVYQVKTEYLLKEI